MLRKLAIALLILGASAAHGSEIVAGSPVKSIFTGNSVSWAFDLAGDGRTLTVKKVTRDVKATNFVLETVDGVEAYDIDMGGRVTRNDDRRLIRDNDDLEIAPVHALVLEMPGKVEKVEWTRPMALQTQVFVAGRYVAVKYAPYPGIAIKGPRTLKVTTDAGKFSFNVVSGTGGAPIYRVMGAQ